MKPLVATYRLQLREHQDFARVASLVPYLTRLGISHLYLAPICEAMPGSTHGYDAVDFNVIEPAIGGKHGFWHLRRILDAKGMGLIVDFVPNHMAASPLNPWWRDLLEWGSASVYARHFDVDWHAPKLLLPVLGKSYGDVLAERLIELRFDEVAGTFALVCQGHAFPLTPPSYATILKHTSIASLLKISSNFAQSSPATTAALKAELAALSADGLAKSIRAAAAVVEADLTLLDDLHDHQIWRLAHWRLGRESLTYRRFFEISDLVGVRIEDPRVFRDVHRLILSLVGQGAIDGLRIDHVDGLADPLAYLQRLRCVVADRPLHVVVEKILGPGEELPAQWPVAGTTGYEFIRALADLFVDGRRERELSAAYAEFIGHTVDFPLMVQTLKRRTLARNLAGELAVLAGQAFNIARLDLRTRDLGLDSLRTAIIEFAAALPLYRTYVDDAGIAPAERKTVEEAARLAKTTREVEDSGAIDFIVRLLTLDLAAPHPRAEALAFARRLQQTTGPLMAKACEDTLFYQYNRLIVLNEVGGEPVRPQHTVADFHATMQRRQAVQPLGLTTTSTHDTKRGEDARARLYAISEVPEEWAHAVTRWSRMNKSFRDELPDGLAPEPNMEWFFYQSLLGAWPAGLQPTDACGISALRVRMAGMMLKAAREAKSRTSWTQAGDTYERALTTFVNKVLDIETGRDFLRDFTCFAAPLFVCGAAIALSQALFKLMAPGVPDVYQGSELWDLSLVDPDNRRAVDFGLRDDLLEQARVMTVEALLETWTSGAIKLRLINDGLTLRRGYPGWADAAYAPLAAHGEHANHLVAFTRTLEDLVVIAIGTRLPFALLKDTTIPLVPARRWGDTSVELPAHLRQTRYDDCITGEPVNPRDRLPISELLRRFPVALLSSKPLKPLRS